MWKLVVFLLVILAIIYYAMLFFQTTGMISFTNRKLKPNRMYIPFYYWFASDKEAPKKKEKSKLVKSIKVKEDGELSQNGDEQPDSDLS